MRAAKTTLKVFAVQLPVLAMSLAIALLLRSASVSGQGVLTVNNELLNASQAVNFTYTPGVPGSEVQVGNQGYLAVGSGEFSRYSLIVTVSSPTPSVGLTFEHGAICNTFSPGSYSGVDHPDNAPAAFMSITMMSQFDPIVATSSTFQTHNIGRDCANLDRSYTMSNLQQLADGTYGGLMYIALLNVPAGVSQTNSFNIVASNPNAQVGYIADIVKRTRDNPFNAPFLPSVGLNREVGINLANTDMPQYSYTNYRVGMSVPCNASDGFSTQIGIFDIDDPSGAATEPPGATGGYFQGTAVYPTARLVVYERDKPTAANPNPPWTANTTDLSGPGSGRNSELLVNTGPFFKDRQYIFTLQNIVRQNAVQFTIKNDRNLSTAAFDEDCSSITDAMTCNVLTPPVLPPGSAVEVEVDITNNTSIDWTSNDAAFSTPGPGVATGPNWDLGVVDLANAYATANGTDTALPWSPVATGSSVGPPDHLSDQYVVANTDGNNTEWHNVAYNRNAAPPPTPDNVYRYGLKTDIPAGETRRFSAYVTAPAAGVTEQYGFRLIDRARQVLVQPPNDHSWLDWSGTCAFDVTGDDGTVATGCSVQIIGDTSFDLGAAITLSARVINTSVSGSIDITDISYTGLPAGTITPAATPAAPITLTDSAPDDRQDFTVTINSPPTAGTYNITWNVQTTGGDCGRPGSIAIVSSPYFRFYGGDVLACGSDGDVTGSGGFLTSSQAVSNYVGSAAELAVLATGQVRGVLTGSQATFRSSFWDLSFANTAGTNGSNLEFGGNFVSCPAGPSITLPSTFDGATPVGGDITSLGSGVYSHSDTDALTGVVGVGERIVIIAAGDVRIGPGSLVYDTAGWNDITDIPSLTIVAAGDIYIEPGDDAAINTPQTLDAHLITETGSIYTCAGQTVTNRDLTTGSASANGYIVSNCDRPLKVNGSLKANRIYFLRAVGSVLAGTVREEFSSAGIAEAIRFAPEAYLTNGGGLPLLNPSIQIDSLIALPPSF